MSKYRLTPFAQLKLQELRDNPEEAKYADLFERTILKGYEMTIGDYSFVTSFFDPLNPPYWTELFTLKNQA